MWAFLCPHSVEKPINLAIAILLLKLKGYLETVCHVTSGEVLVVGKSTPLGIT
jgi:hypothetical protein